jgi:hypothetical protein
LIETIWTWHFLLLLLLLASAGITAAEFAEDERSNPANNLWTLFKGTATG